MNHKYKFGRRINWRSLLLAMVFPICFTVSHYANLDNTYVADPDVFMKPMVVKPEPTLEDKIREHFPRSWRDFIEIAHAESRMQVDAIGYNCFYYQGKATTTPIKKDKYGNGSKSCKEKDRALAWSLDCGLMQLNTLSKECPKRDTSKEYLDEHLKAAAKLSRVQGKCAWYCYPKWEQECNKKLAKK